MKKIISKFVVLLLAFSMITSTKVSAAPDREKLDSSISSTINKVMALKAKPAFNDEWSIIALARSGEVIPENFYDTYYKSVEEKVKNEFKKEVPFTSDPENDDWSGINDVERLVIALNSIGKDPENVAGYNLLNVIFNRENLADELGISGLTYALIAIDTKNYTEPKGAINTRDSIIKDMLSIRTKDGGFSWDSTADEADLDSTAMAIQALYKYTDRKDVKEAVDRGLAILKSKQSENGDYVSSYMGMTFESPCTAAQVVVALDNLKMDPTKSENGFVKNKDLIDVLESYYVTGGGFKNSSDETEANSMTTDQILYSLVSYRNLLDGKNSLYDMNEVKTDSSKENSKEENKTENPVVEPDKTQPESIDVGVTEKTETEQKIKDKENQPEINNEDNSEEYTEEKDNKSSEVSENVKTGDNNLYIAIALLASGMVVYKSRINSNIKKKVV